MATDFDGHDEMISLIWASLSGGRQASRCTVSRSIPRNGRRVVGPLSLSSAIGMLRTLNSHLISLRFWAHSSVSWAWLQLQVANTPSFGAKSWQKIALV